MHRSEGMRPSSSGVRSFLAFFRVLRVQLPLSPLVSLVSMTSMVWSPSRSLMQVRSGSSLRRVLRSARRTAASMRAARQYGHSHGAWPGAVFPRR